MSAPFDDYAEEILGMTSEIRQVTAELPLSGRLILPVQQDYAGSFHSVGRVGLPLRIALSAFLRNVFSECVGQPCVSIHSEPNFDCGFLVYVRPFLAFASAQESMLNRQRLATRALARVCPHELSSIPAA
jgi:hypothetical protein